MMIKNLMIENFKCVSNMNIECNNINVFVGTNSSGKSTILQALLFFAQNIKEEKGLNGDYISIGGFEENRCYYSRKNSINVGIIDYYNNKNIIELYKENDVEHIKYVSDDFEEFRTIQNFFIENKKQVQYLSCHRVGPQDLYKKNMSLFDDIGTNGQFSIAYLNKHSSDAMNEDFCKYKGNYTFGSQVNWWLNYIVGAKISTSSIPSTDYVKASYSMNDINEIRPQNIGSGVSYLVSVVITCLSAPEDSIIVIENPEIHLHPAAQSKVAEFLYFVSKHKRQIFIETHSDHIFNGYRAGIANSEMDQNDINIYYVSQDEEHNTNAMLVQIGRMGRIENQVEGLFDQFDIDLNKMIGV